MGPRLFRLSVTLGDDIYFDTANLTHSFPLQWRIDQAREWPLSSSITHSLQTPLALTQASVALEDPNGSPVPIASLGSSNAAPYALAWRFSPAMEGSYRFTLAARELPDPLVKSSEVQTVPFSGEQDHALSSGTPGDTTLITYMLSSPVLLTHLTSTVLDPQATPLTTTFVSSNFKPGWHNFVWQFTAKSSGWHTVTLDADEFMQPFARRILVFAARVYLPVVLRG